MMISAIGQPRGESPRRTSKGELQVLRSAFALVSVKGRHTGVARSPLNFSLCPLLTIPNASPQYICYSRGESRVLLLVLSSSGVVLMRERSPERSLAFIRQL